MFLLRFYRAIVLTQELYEENQLRIKLQMEIDSKDSEIEQLTQKLASVSADTASSISSGPENDSEECVQVRIQRCTPLRDSVLAARLLVHPQDSWLEGWLSIPSKQNIRRHGWRKQYVVVSSKKIFF